MNNESIKEEILEKFPEFRQTEEFGEIFDDDGPYIYISYFGDFLLKNIDQSEHGEIVKRAFRFINDVYSRPEMSAEVWDLLGIELLERLGVNSKYGNIARKYSS